jgi:hypothetical protein
MTTRASVDTIDTAIRLFYEIRADNLYALAMPIALTQNGNEAAAPGVRRPNCVPRRRRRAFFLQSTSTRRRSPLGRWSSLSR